MIKCIQCQAEKSEVEFYTQKDRKYCYKMQPCKICKSQIGKIYYLKNKEDIEFQRKRKVRALKYSEINKTKSKERYIKNKKEYQKYKKERYSENPRAVREYALKTKFGIDLVEYGRILSYQGNACAICQISEIDYLKNQKLPLARNPHSMGIDHDHQTNLIRGILCKNCNIGLGAFKDSCLNMERAILYLKKNFSNEKLLLVRPSLIKEMERRKNKKIIKKSKIE